MRTCQFIAYNLSLEQALPTICYDVPKTAKVVDKHTKKERKVETYSAILLLYMIMMRRHQQLIVTMLI